MALQFSFNAFIRPNMVDVFEAQMTCDECQEAKLKIKLIACVSNT